LKTILLRVLIFLLIVSPLIGGGIWIYKASAAAFALQHAIRDAQNTRGNLVRILLAKESDVRGFAATGSPYFLNDFRKNADMFTLSEKRLLQELHNIDARFDTQALEDEMVLYHQWEKTVAAPIFAHRPGVIEPLLRTTDPLFSAKFLAEDSKIQDFLNDAVSSSEQRRQTLLRRILFASIALVASAGLAVGILLWMHERAERIRFVHALQLQEEQRVTEKLQRAIMPESLPEIAGIALQAIYVPAAQEHLVGGDWYDVLELPDKRVLCIIGDVAGHGIDAAAQMNRARQSIVAAALIESDPAHILLRANAHLTGLSGNMVTVLCGILDLNSMHFTYATAGHPAPVLATPQQGARVLANGGPPLGIFTELELESVRYCIEQHDCIYLFTDGLLEDRRDVLSGETSIVEQACLASRALHPATSLYHAIIVSDKPRDDVAVLSITMQ